MTAITVNVRLGYTGIQSAKRNIQTVNVIKALKSYNKSTQIWQKCSFPQCTHSPLTGHALLPLPPSLCTMTPTAWFHCEGAAWTSYRPCGGGTLGLCQCSPGWVQPARVQAVGWGAHWKAGSLPCNWKGPVCAPYGSLHTVLACWAQSGGRRHHRTASLYPPWREIPPTPCLLALQWSHCWSAWTSHA